MVNLDLLFLVGFGFLLLIIVLFNKKSVEFQKIAFPLLYVVMYRTKLGLKAMDVFAKKFGKTLRYLQYIVIFIGFLGMAAIIFFLLKGMFDYLFKEGLPPVGILLPGVEVAPGLPTISFWHFIIAIFVLAVVHEFSHGIFARYYDVKVKSSGFAVFGILLPILPAAFVEPDEEQLSKRKKREQLAVLAAGSFANFLTATVVFLIFILIVAPWTNGMVSFNDVEVVKVEENKPAFNAGIKENERIISLNNRIINNVSDFVDEMSKVKPGNNVMIATDKNNYEFKSEENPNNASRAYIGIFVQPVMEFKDDVVNKYGNGFIKTAFWFRYLLFWIWVANVGVGLFNLLPLGIVDGGKMFYLALLFFIKDENKSKRVWKYVGIALGILILIALLPQFNNLIIKPLANLFGKIF